MHNSHSRNHTEDECTQHYAFDGARDSAAHSPASLAGTSDAATAPPLDRVNNLSSHSNDSTTSVGSSDSDFSDDFDGTVYLGGDAGEEWRRIGSFPGEIMSPVHAHPADQLGVEQTEHHSTTEQPGLQRHASYHQLHYPQHRRSSVRSLTERSR